MIKEAAKGALDITIVCLGVAALLEGALWIVEPLYRFAGIAGVFGELIALIFLAPFLGSLFLQRFLSRRTGR